MLEPLYNAFFFVKSLVVNSINSIDSNNSSDQTTTVAVAIPSQPNECRIVSIEINYKLKPKIPPRSLASRTLGVQKGKQYCLASRSTSTLVIQTGNQVLENEPMKLFDESIKVDSDHQILWQPGDILAKRYKVISKLGQGTFAKVLEVKDLKKKKVIALKVTKCVEKFKIAAELEINVLKTIRLKDPLQKFLCLQMLDSFDLNEHKCICFEKMGPSVFDILKENNFNPYPTSEICHIMYQVCLAVKFLHSNQMIHTDLKPENILFEISDCYYTKSPNVKLIDFGSTLFEWQIHPPVITTRHYRAAEVILGLEWNRKCDVWSVGCTLLELYLGYPVFQASEDDEHLAMMEKVLGPIPVKMTKKSKLFNKGVLNWDERTKAGKFIKKNCQKLRTFVQGEETQCLINLAQKMLKYDIDERISMASVLDQDFFKSIPNEYIIK